MTNLKEKIQMSQKEVEEFNEKIPCFSENLDRYAEEIKSAILKNKFELNSALRIELTFIPIIQKREFRVSIRYCLPLDTYLDVCTSSIPEVFATPLAKFLIKEGFSFEQKASSAKVFVMDLV